MKALAIVFLMFIGTASAEDLLKDKHDINQQRMISNLSKRPYSAPVEKKPEVFEGSAEKEDESKKYKTLNLHQLGRRPYQE